MNQIEKDHALNTLTRLNCPEQYIQFIKSQDAKWFEIMIFVIDIMLQLSSAYRKLHDGEAALNCFPAMIAVSAKDVIDKADIEFNPKPKTDIEHIMLVIVLYLKEIDKSSGPGVLEWKEFIVDHLTNGLRKTSPEFFTSE